jgi:CBS domain-containing protein
MTAVSVMTAKPLTVTPEEPVSSAAKLMIDHGISGLPAIDKKGNLRSIVTKTDIIRAMAVD